MTVPSGLTRRQSQALRFIRAYILEQGCSPSFEEIRAALGVRSKGYISHLVDLLIERGAVTMKAGQARSVAPITIRALTLDLPPDLDASVRRLADEAGTTPEAVVTEIVRDRMSASPSSLRADERGGMR